MSAYRVVASAGSFRRRDEDVVQWSHRWTDEGVSVEADFTGAHLLHLSVAGCVLNDLYREAGRLGRQINGVRVTAEGDFDPGSWSSTGITYTVEIDSPDAQEEIAALLRLVDDVAEVPKAVRAGMGVERRTP